MPSQEIGPSGIVAAVEADLELIRLAADLALADVAAVDGRAVAPSREALAALARFDEPLPEHGADATETLRLLHDVAGPATVANTGPNYFGFVTGSTLPPALGAAFLTSAWDQNVALPQMSPAAAREKHCLKSRKN